MPSLSAILQSSSAVDLPRNPSDLRFVGWTKSSGEPLDGQNQAVSLHQLSSAHYIWHMNDHSYADNRTNDRTMPTKINVALSIYLYCVCLQRF